MPGDHLAHTSETSLIEDDCFPSIGLAFVSNFVALPGVKTTVIATEK